MIKLNSFLKLVGLLFAGRSVFGILYLFMGWDASIAGWIMPSWLMVMAIVVDGYLAYVALKLAK